MPITEKDIIGKLVADDYRMAEVFKKYQIDFCCNGKNTIEQACAKKGIEQWKVVSELNDKKNTRTDHTIDYDSWPIDLLADHIEKKHHRYVEEKIPVLKQYLLKLCKVHGPQHPELLEINELFDQMAKELSLHLKKEELVLFPFIRMIAEAKKNNLPLNIPDFCKIENPILVLMNEHEIEGERFRKIRELSKDYSPPADACNTYRVTLALLNEFEEDLHLHIHLENNILFPKAIAFNNNDL